MDRSAQDPTAPGASSTSTGDSDRLTPDEQNPTDALKDISARFGELGEYVSYLLSAKVDAIKVSVRNAGLYAGLGVVGLMAGGAFVVTTVVLLCRGIAGGLGTLFGGGFWLGDIVASILFLGLLVGGVMFMMNRLTKASRDRTAKKYASRQQQQRARFGTDVHERAASPGKAGE